MGFAVYKPGQGYWTRVLTAVAVGTIVLSGIGWFLNGVFQTKILPKLGAAAQTNDLYWKAGIAVTVILVTGALLWTILNKPNIADFMIATENEMKKVNWPSQKAVIGLTWVVISGTLMIASLLYVINIVFSWFFIEIDILHV